MRACEGLRIAIGLSMLAALAGPSTARAVAVGNCNGDDAVTVDELLIGVGIALGQRALADCPSFDADGDGSVGVDEIILAVDNAIDGIPPDLTPSPKPTGTPTPTGSQTGAIVLADRSEAAGVATLAAGCLVFRDLDGDGRPDLLVAPVDDQGVYTSSLTLFRNNGDGTFRTDTIPLPLVAIHACTAGDLNGDGKMDLLILGDDAHFFPALAYLASKGDGQFRDLSVGLPPLSHDIEGVQSLAVFDYDADGRLDIVVGAFGPPPEIERCETTADGSACYLSARTPPPLAPTLFHNVDGTRFEPASITFPHVIRANAFNFFDWDGDGYIDVFVSGDYGPNRFYHNLAGKGFADMLPGWGLGRYNHGMGVVVDDFDDDGQWDIYVAELGDGVLYSGQPDGTLARGSAPSLLSATRTDNIWSPVAADLDNDGRLDVFAPSGAYASSLTELYTMAKNLVLPATIEQSDCLIRNAGGGVFEPQRLANSSTVMALYPKQAATADYDGDGKVDIATLEHAPSYALRLLHNESPVTGNHWLEMRLIGRSGNRDQIGAIAAVFEGGVEIARRAVNIGGIGISSPVVHVGIGPRVRIDAARVRWADGTVTQLPGPLEVDRIIDVHEP